MNFVRLFCLFACLALATSSYSGNYFTYSVYNSISCTTIAAYHESVASPYPGSYSITNNSTGVCSIKYNKGRSPYNLITYNFVVRSCGAGSSWAGNQCLPDAEDACCGANEDECNERFKQDVAPACVSDSNSESGSSNWVSQFFPVDGECAEFSAECGELSEICDKEQWVANDSCKDFCSIESNASLLACGECQSLGNCSDSFTNDPGNDGGGSGGGDPIDPDSGTGTGGVDTGGGGTSTGGGGTGTDPDTTDPDTTDPDTTDPDTTDPDTTDPDSTDPDGLGSLEALNGQGFSDIVDSFTSLENLNGQGFSDLSTGINTGFSDLSTGINTGFSDLSAGISSDIQGLGDGISSDIDSLSSTIVAGQQENKGVLDSLLDIFEDDGGSVVSDIQSSNSVSDVESDYDLSTFSFDKEGWLGAGSCPLGESFVVKGQTFTFSLDFICSLSSVIKPLLILITMFWAGLSFIRTLGG